MNQYTAKIKFNRNISKGIINQFGGSNTCKGVVIIYPKQPVIYYWERKWTLPSNPHCFERYHEGELFNIASQGLKKIMGKH